MMIYQFFLNEFEKRRLKNSMFKGESETDRIKRYIKVSPKKKLEWLQQMHEMVSKHISKREIKLRQKLRDML